MKGTKKPVTRRKYAFILVIVLSFSTLAAYLLLTKNDITNFEECAKAGYPVAESYPRRCNITGKVFIEEIADDSKVKGNVDAKAFHIGVLSETDKRMVVIKSQAEWQKLWRETHPKPSEVTKVDFEKVMLVAFLAGTKPTAGYAVEVESVEESDGRVLFTVVETSPGENCINAQVITDPYVIVETPKTEKNLEFNYKEKINNCG